jgi:nucleotide-binding universal stress UspA family protein
MSTFTKIIVGDDGLAGGADAVALAHALAPDAEVLLASAYPWDATPSRFVQPGYGNALREDTEQALAARAAAAGFAHLRTVALPDTSPARALLRLAEDEHADLLVVGASRHSAIGRRILGDVGRGVLHGAPCPVAVAPRGYAEDAHALTSVGVAFDHSPAARHALAVAHALAAERGLPLRLREVVAPEVIPAIGGYPMVDVGELSGELQEDAQQRLNAVVGALDGSVATEAKAVLGSTRDGLGELAGEVDLLVCGSRGWGAFRRVMLGSTSDRLVHEAPCPVLVVPGAAEAAAGDDADAADATTPASA